MNIAIWILTGAMLGWLGYKILYANEARGLVGSMIIGAVGGFAGGKLLAPIFGAAASSQFSMLAMIVAGVSAAALLALGNAVSNRFNI